MLMKQQTEQKKKIKLQKKKYQKNMKYQKKQFMLK